MFHMRQLLALPDRTFDDLTFGLLLGSGLPASTAAKSGLLTLGGTDHSLFPVTTKSLNAALAAIVSSWVIGLVDAGIKLDGTSVTNVFSTEKGRATARQGTPVGPSIIVLDSGTPFMANPNLGTAKSLYAQVSAEIQPLNNSDGVFAVLDAVTPQLTFVVAESGTTNNNNGKSLELRVPKAGFN